MLKIDSITSHLPVIRSQSAASFKWSFHFLQARFIERNF
jgi:hypothetical protein